MYPGGTGTNGSVTLTDANTAYAVPASANTVRTVLVLYNNTTNNMYWGYENSNANGVLLPPRGFATVNIGANQQVYAYCGTAAQAITYSSKAAA